MNSTSPRVALVTGAARRIGAEIVRKLHAEGMNVILHYHGSHSAADDIANELNALRENSLVTLQFDLLDTENIDTFIQQAVSVWGRLDTVVNNASTFYPTAIDDISIEHWNDLIGVNVQAPLFICKACAPFLTQQQGCIVNIVDIHADRPLKGYPVYAIAKAGLAMLTKSMARELAPAVRVNGIAPGAIMWPEIEDYEAVHQEIIERTALKREGHPSDIADTAWYLINTATYVTGQIIAVDGGRTLSN